MLRLWPQSSQYLQVPSDPEESTTHEASSREEIENNGALESFTGKFSRLSPQALVSVSVIVAVITGVVGFGAGAFIFKEPKHFSHVVDVVPLVPIGTSIQTSIFNKSFAAPPSGIGSPEPIWDSLIPNGLGYVKDAPFIGHNFSVISVFHQLHCLYTLRRAYYSTYDGGEDFDFGLDRTNHTGHCFEYLRQSIMCAADSTLEPAENIEQGYLGWGFRRQCRNYNDLMQWAEKWRAFNGRGFLAQHEGSG